MLYTEGMNKPSPEMELREPEPVLLDLLEPLQRVTLGNLLISIPFLGLGVANFMWASSLMGSESALPLVTSAAVYLFGTKATVVAKDTMQRRTMKSISPLEGI